MTIYRHRITIQNGGYEYTETIFTRDTHDPEELLLQYYADDALKHSHNGIYEDNIGNWYIPRHMNEPIRSLGELVS